MAAEVQELVSCYVHARSDYMHSVYLETLVSHTTGANYRQIIEWIQSEEISRELDLSMYIAEISSRGFSDLEKVIHSLKPSFRDPDAIQDLDRALEKLKH